MARQNCANFNHLRANPSVRFCPECGEVINADLPVRDCSTLAHARSRKEHMAYCVRCGERLKPDSAG